MDAKDHENFLMGALVGGAVGAAAALLLTPYPGTEIRKKVRKGISQLNGSQIKAHAEKLAAALHNKPKKKTVKRKSPAKRSPSHKSKS